MTTCNERVKSAADSRLTDLRIMLCGPRIDDVQLVDDGTLDTVLSIPDVDVELRFSDTSDHRDDDGTLDVEALLIAERYNIDDECRERFYDYGLEFSYVTADTYDDQDSGYFRFLISWGGPSEEIRFFTDPALSLVRAEFWFLDWYDGARVDVTNDDAIRAMFEHFSDCESLRSALTDAGV